MTQTAAQRKAAERGRHKDAGRVAVTHYIYPADRPRLARYVARLVRRVNPNTKRTQDAENSGKGE
jgi:hypothetical protein